MKLVHCVLCAVGVSVAIGCTSKPDTPSSADTAPSKPDQMELLQGVWTFDAMETAGGKPIPEDKLKQIRVIIHKDLLHFEEDAKTHRGRTFEFKIDGEQQPKRIDLSVKFEPTSHSIYKFDGDDKLTIAFAGGEIDPVARPTEFKPIVSDPKTPRYTVVVFKLSRTKEEIPKEYIEAEKIRQQNGGTIPTGPKVQPTRITPPPPIIPLPKSN